jgi:hypothetical protein
MFENIKYSKLPLSRIKNYIYLARSDESLHPGGVTPVAAPNPTGMTDPPSPDPCWKNPYVKSAAGGNNYLTVEQFMFPCKWRAQVDVGTVLPRYYRTNLRYRYLRRYDMSVPYRTPAG